MANMMKSGKVVLGLALGYAATQQSDAPLMALKVQDGTKKRSFQENRKISNANMAHKRRKLDARIAEHKQTHQKRMGAIDRKQKKFLRKLNNRPTSEDRWKLRQLNKPQLTVKNLPDPKAAKTFRERLNDLHSGTSKRDRQQLSRNLRQMTKKEKANPSKPARNWIHQEQISRAIERAIPVPTFNHVAQKPKWHDLRYNDYNKMNNTRRRVYWNNHQPKVAHLKTIKVPKVPETPAAPAVPVIDIDDFYSSNEDVELDDYLDTVTSEPKNVAQLEAMDAQYQQASPVAISLDQVHQWLKENPQSRKLVGKNEGLMQYVTDAGNIQEIHEYIKTHSTSAGVRYFKYLNDAYSPQ